MNPNDWEAYLSLDRSATFFLSGSLWIFMNSAYLFGMQVLLRHNGIGSLPSATTTACSARTAALAGLAVLAGIAQYNPASATTVSKTSITLFIGGGSPSRVVLRVAKYIPTRLSLRSKGCG